MAYYAIIEKWSGNTETSSIWETNDIGLQRCIHVCGDGYMEKEKMGWHEPFDKSRPLSVLSTRRYKHMEYNEITEEEAFLIAV